MKDAQDAYNMLQLPVGSSLDQVEKRYRQLAQVWHPDRFGTEELKAFAEENMKNINAARDLLMRAGAAARRRNEEEPEHWRQQEEAARRRQDQERRRRQEEETARRRQQEEEAARRRSEEQRRRRQEAAARRREEEEQRRRKSQAEGDARRQDFAPFRDAPYAPELVALPAGEFWMGSPETEEDRFEFERPRHKVTIAYRYAIGRYPVTFAEYDRFCEATRRQKPGDEGWGRERRPVINVIWHDAQAYAAWLARETGRPYRLPSEAEWEYACRAGTRTRYSFGDAITPALANYYDSGLRRTSEVGSYPANPWGLHDMHGNVWEWVADDWHDSYKGAPIDGSARMDKGSYHARRRVLRGGSWGDYSEHCRSAYRIRLASDHRNGIIGFRVARTLINS
jgi:formylglycine-generating enzyme required for sulfatase activity